MPPLSPRVLVLEDDLVLHKVLTRIFERSDFMVQLDFCDSIGQAREYLKTSQPDIALYDLNLPDGLSLDLLAERGQRLAYPVVILTGAGNEGAAVESLKRGASDYIVKDPDTLTGLPVLLRNIMSAWRDRDRHERLQHLHQNIVDSVSDAIINIDVDLLIFSANAAAQTMFGYTEDELMGELLSRLIPEVRREDYAVLEHMFESGEGVPVMDSEILTKDGRLIPVSVSLSPLAGDDQKVQMVTAVIRDISLQQHEEALRREKLEIEGERRLLLAQLASGVAHEIKNPLGIVLGHSQTLRRLLATTDPDQLRCLETIDNQVHRMSEILDSLFEFGRKSGENDEVVDLRDVVANVARLLEYRFQESDVALEIELPESLPCRGASVELQQVLINIIVNALDSLEESKTSKGQITVRPDVEGDQVGLCVIDNGPGFTSESLKRALDPFFTTKPQGGGLGLAVSRSILERHGGHILIKPDYPGGYVCCRVPVLEKKTM